MNRFELWEKVARNSQCQLPQHFRLVVILCAHPWKDGQAELTWDHGITTIASRMTTIPLGMQMVSGQTDRQTKKNLTSVAGII